MLSSVNDAQGLKSYLCNGILKISSSRLKSRLSLCSQHEQRTPVWLFSLRIEKHFIRAIAKKWRWLVLLWSTLFLSNLFLHHIWLVQLITHFFVIGPLTFCMPFICYLNSYTTSKTIFPYLSRHALFQPSCKWRTYVNDCMKLTKITNHKDKAELWLSKSRPLRKLIK